MNSLASHEGEMNITRQLDRIHLVVSFTIGSLVGLNQGNDRLKSDVAYPVQLALPMLPDFFITTFLHTSA